MPIEPAEHLRLHGLQVTAQRMALLRAVDERPHGTADDFIEIVRREIGTVSRQAVYDGLALLVEKGVLRRIQPAGSPARYEERVGDNHHHLVCRGCGVIVDVDCAVGTRPCLTAAEDAGFEIDEAEVVYWGRCPTCRTAAGTGAPAPAEHHLSTHQH
jgi:Fur family ferric uptake transcriptional regulator